MAGGAWEYVMGYTTGATSGKDSSGITRLYSDFYNDTNYTKYWDKYTSTIDTNFNNRILGDATGEMGPFVDYKDGDAYSRHHNQWYGDRSYFFQSSYPWFNRGGVYDDGVLAGQFTFGGSTGGASAGFGSRLVLAP